MKFSILKASVLILLLNACATGYQPAVDYNPEFNFSQFNSFAIVDLMPIDDSETKPINRHLSDIDNDRIIKALKRTLENKGMVETDKENADMLVKYLVASKDKTRVRSYNSSFYNCWHCRGIYGPRAPTQVDVTNYVEGTLIVDLIDPATQKSVWRSVVSKAVPKNVPVNEKQAHVQKLVDATMASFKAPTPVQ